jgi:hypothetical protein
MKNCFCSVTKLLFFGPLRIRVLSVSKEMLTEAPFLCLSFRNILFLSFTRGSQSYTLTNTNARTLKHTTHTHLLTNEHIHIHIHIHTVSHSPVVHPMRHTISYIHDLIHTISSTHTHTNTHSAPQPNSTSYPRHTHTRILSSLFPLFYTDTVLCLFELG